MEEECDEPVEDEEYRERTKEIIPEPEDKVNLLIDDILKWQLVCDMSCNTMSYLCEHTQSIVHLGTSCSSYIGYVAGGHGREHGAGRVPKDTILQGMVVAEREFKWISYSIIFLES